MFNIWFSWLTPMFCSIEWDLWKSEDRWSLNAEGRKCCSQKCSKRASKLIVAASVSGSPFVAFSQCLWCLTQMKSSKTKSSVKGEGSAIVSMENSLSLSFCLFFCIPFFLSVCLFVCLFVFFLSFFLSFCSFFIYLFLSLSLFLFGHFTLAMVSIISSRIMTQASNTVTRYSEPPKAIPTYYRVYQMLSSV